MLPGRKFSTASGRTMSDISDDREFTPPTVEPSGPGPANPYDASLWPGLPLPLDIQPGTNDPFIIPDLPSTTSTPKGKTPVGPLSSSNAPTPKGAFIMPSNESSPRSGHIIRIHHQTASARQLLAASSVVASPAALGLPFRPAALDSLNPSYLLWPAALGCLALSLTLLPAAPGTAAFGLTFRLAVLGQPILGLTLRQAALGSIAPSGPSHARNLPPDALSLTTPFRPSSHVASSPVTGPAIDPVVRVTTAARGLRTDVSRTILPLLFSNSVCSHTTMTNPSTQLPGMFGNFCESNP